MSLLKQVARIGKPSVRGFFKRTGQRISDEISYKDQLGFTAEQLYDMAGPTSIMKIENDALKEGLDIFSQFDHGTPLKIVGEGTEENPFLIPSRNPCRLVLFDYSAEAPGVQGLGDYLCANWMWEDGSSDYGEQKLNRCREGYFYKVVKWDMPEIELADSQSHGDWFL